MSLIKYGVLALSLALVTACGQKEEAAAPAESATVAAPAVEPAPAAEQAPAQDAAPAAMEDAATPVPVMEGASMPETASATAPTCPTNCVYARCPPPSGPYACCTKTVPFKVCTVQ